jgi:hypothetical protein
MHKLNASVKRHFINIGRRMESTNNAELREHIIKLALEKARVVGFNDEALTLAT